MSPDFSGAQWIRSSRSQQATDQCVEVAFIPGLVGIRDSKDSLGPRLVITNDKWRALLQAIKA
ncbi:DUF397 domain-containing protein [Spirillospora sp. NPDC047279]|uniref:DUF397 domain-containing protein n=1 Tax=Spirillospora sp. NPDC047279 TaxID=3155478 RepID=UPI0033C027AE